MGTERPVKQQQAADYLGVSKDTVRKVIAAGHVLRHGGGEGMVLTGSILAALRLYTPNLPCPTCGHVQLPVVEKGLRGMPAPEEPTT